MSIKIVNEYITEVLQLESFKKELERAKAKYKVQPVSPSSDTNSDDQNNNSKENNDNPEILVDPNAELFFQRINRRR